MSTKTCEAPDCDNVFEAERSTARFCGATCRQRAARSSRAAEAEAQVEPDPDDEVEVDEEGKPAEHALVKATRSRLRKDRATDTVAGQLALQMARRIASPDTAGISALSKELRSLLVEAKAEALEGEAPAAEPASSPAGQVEDDDVARARARKEAKAAAMQQQA